MRRPVPTSGGHNPHLTRIEDCDSETGTIEFEYPLIHRSKDGQTRIDRAMKPLYPAAMTDVLEIEKAIEKLPPEDYGRLRDWIENHDLERDAETASACIAEMLDEEDGGEDQLAGR